MKKKNKIKIANITKMGVNPGFKSNLVKKIIKIDPKTGDFLVYTEEEYLILLSHKTTPILKEDLEPLSNSDITQLCLNLIEIASKNDTLDHDINLICPNCQGHLPDKSFFTQRKTKCIWCDASYWEKHDK
jgi:hypothetical protein